MPVSDAMVEAASNAVVAEWQIMLQEHRGQMSAAESARAFVSPGNYRLIKAALEAAALALIEDRLRATIIAMRDRDDRNDSLPPWYREQIDAALAQHEDAG